jgi:hypothetical protein
MAMRLLGTRFVGKISRTVYRLTTAGQQALAADRDHMAGVFDAIG